MLPWPELPDRSHPDQSARHRYRHRWHRTWAERPPSRHLGPARHPVARCASPLPQVSRERSLRILVGRPLRCCHRPARVGDALLPLRWLYGSGGIPGGERRAIDTRPRTPSKALKSGPASRVLRYGSANEVPKRALAHAPRTARRSIRSRTSGKEGGPVLPREALRHLGEPAPRFREHSQQREVAEKVDALPVPAQGRCGRSVEKPTTHLVERHLDQQGLAIRADGEYRRPPRNFIKGTRGDAVGSDCQGRHRVSRSEQRRLVRSLVGLDQGRLGCQRHEFHDPLNPRRRSPHQCFARCVRIHEQVGAAESERHRIRCASERRRDPQTDLLAALENNRRRQEFAEPC